MRGLKPMHLTDAYKLDHRRQYPNETKLVYSNWTPRKSRVEGIDHVVLFGLQYFIKKYLLDEFNYNFFRKPKEQVIKQYLRRVNNYLGSDNNVGTTHIERLHDLGYLPITIKALPEGAKSPIKCAQVTVYNTHPDFFWLTNYIETLMSCTLWGPCTSATTAWAYREIFEYWAKETGADSSFCKRQGHDFSARGMFGVEAAEMSGGAHLTSFVGSDTIFATDWLEDYYQANSDTEEVASSVAATEHAVMCVGTGFYIQKEDLTWEKYGEAEFAVFHRLITEIYPKGILSIVSDTWSLRNVVLKYLPLLKKTILAREGKIVIRPDSGDPVKILTGYFDDEIVELEKIDKTKYWIEKGKPAKHLGRFEIDGLVQALWDVFGGTTTSKGHRVLDTHIGCIYGDSITLQRAEEICTRLAMNNFASTNWVAGIGSYTYQYVTRDTFGFAMKATYAEVDLTGKIIGIPVFKNPETDDGTKKSAKGLISVHRKLDTEGTEYEMMDDVTWDEEESGHLEEVFKNGALLKEWTLKEIRERLWPVLAIV